LPQTSQPRPVIVRREICRPSVYSVAQPQIPGRHLVREIVRQIPQPAQPALICIPQQQTTAQQLVPVFSTRQVSFQKTGTL
jgi:hypothetical protein